MGTHADSIAALRALADMGVQIAIDDFGTGYSNLAYLRHLPVHTLKLAGTFLTRGDHHDRPGDGLRHRRRARPPRPHPGAVGHRRSSGDSRPAEHLRELGCDTGQGWHFAPALPPQQIPALLHTPTWNHTPLTPRCASTAAAPRPPPAPRD